MSKDLARSSLAVLLALAVIVPMLNYHRVPPMATFYSELAAAFLFLAAGAAAAPLLPRRQAIDGYVAVFCFGLLALLAYQVVSGGYYQFMMSWASWAAFLCLFFLAVALGQLAATDLQLRSLIVDRLAAALLLVALFNAFAQVAQMTGWALQIRPLVFIASPDVYASYACAPAGNIGQRNHANALAWLGAAALLFAVIRGQARPLPALTGFVVLLGSSVLTSSRMAFLMAPALAGSLVVACQSIGWPRRRALTVGALIIGGLIVATVIRQLVLSGCQSSLERAVGGFAAGTYGHGPTDYWIRLEMVRQAIEIWWSQPIVGVGVGKFMAKSFALESHLDVVEPLDFYPHDTILEVLVSFGLIGAVLLFVCAGVWLTRVWRNRNSAIEYWFLIAALVIICIPALLEIALWYLYFLLPFGLMLGIAIGPVPAKSLSLRLPWRWLFPSAAVLALPALGFAAVDHFHAERVVWLSQLARIPSPMAGGAAAELPEEVRQLRLFAVWGEHEELRFGEEQSDNLAAQMAANQRLLGNIPNPHIVARQIMLETLAGHLDKARDLFRRMMVFFPEYYKVLADELRVRAEARPTKTGALLKILDEETAQPPRERGGR